METWTMVGAKRARNAERPTQPSLDLTSRAPWFYPDPSLDGSTRASPPWDPKRLPNTVLAWSGTKGTSYPLG